MELKTSSLLWTLLVLVLAQALVACGSSSETLVVVERPQADTSVVAGEADSPAPAPSVPDAVLLPQVEPFAMGRLWTLDRPPLDHLQSTYGFRPDSMWFVHARDATLRLPDCTASFVSGKGLVVTNYHCVRRHLRALEEPGEDLRTTGFIADSAGAERRMERLFADQLLGETDVTSQVRSALASVVDDDRRVEVLRRTLERLEERLTSEAKLQDTTQFVQIIELHSGRTYAAYRYRRYHDLRLVMVPEAAVGAFGGDTDNFTFPRHTLDVAFLRAYDVNGNPVVPDHAFEWSSTGVDSGDVVFVTGNPGTTSRLNTVSAIQVERDVELPPQIEVLSSRVEALRTFIERYPAVADSFGVRETLHSVANARKEAEGRLRALNDPSFMDRIRALHAHYDAGPVSVDTLRAPYVSTLRQIDELQQSKRAMASQQRAFALFGSSNFDSHVIVRSLYAFLYDFARQRNASSDFLENYVTPAMALERWPAELEKMYLAQRLRELRDHLGASDPTVRSILGGRTPSAVAEGVVDRTALVDSTGFRSLIRSGYLNSGDPTVSIAQAIVPLFLSLIQQQAAVEARESRLLARLADIRITAGEELVPDATFSLRLSDGVVSGYPHNGTLAAAYTTFFGMYNMNASRPGGEEWDLPEGWHGPPRDLDLGTPLNFVSTVDITGGSSGSPTFDSDLRLVGIAFDSNIESLGNVYAYTEEGGARAIAVDARAVIEALRSIYRANDLVDELLRQDQAVAD